MGSVAFWLCNIEPIEKDHEGSGNCHSCRRLGIRGRCILSWPYEGLEQ